MGFCVRLTNERTNKLQFNHVAIANSDRNNRKYEKEKTKDENNNSTHTRAHARNTQSLSLRRNRVTALSLLRRYSIIVCNKTAQMNRIDTYVCDVFGLIPMCAFYFLFTLFLRILFICSLALTSDFRSTPSFSGGFH